MRQENTLLTDSKVILGSGKVQKKVMESKVRLLELTDMWCGFRFSHPPPWENAVGLNDTIQRREAGDESGIGTRSAGFHDPELGRSGRLAYVGNRSWQPVLKEWKQS